MKISLALSALIGILIGATTVGVILIAHDDFFWYRNLSMMGSLTPEASVDAVFIEQMIPHHESAIAMAELALTHAKTAEVQQLAQNILATQQEEIDAMKWWYSAWFAQEVPSSSLAMSEMSSSHAIHNQSAWKENLLSAKDFDKAFITEMIPHHEMAVMMAQMLLPTTSRTEMKTLGQQIIDGQSSEIDDMQTWLTTWK